MCVMCGDCNVPEWKTGDCAIVPDGRIRTVAEIDPENGLAYFGLDDNGFPDQIVWLDDLREC